MGDRSRREFLKAGLFGGVVAGITGWARGSYLPLKNPTPHEVEGPFYPITAQKDKDFDLTRVEGRPESAAGTIIVIEGRVIASDGSPIEEASVDLWQANAAGRYRHPHDQSAAPLDPNFQGWAIVPSGKNGDFRFKTIMPGSYPASGSWSRPPHIHFKVSKRGYVELVTQMYFPDHPLNEPDLLLRRKGKAEQAQMIAKRVKQEPETYRYEIVLQKA